MLKTISGLYLYKAVEHTVIIFYETILFFEKMLATTVNDLGIDWRIKL